MSADKGEALTQLQKKLLDVVNELLLQLGLSARVQQCLRKSKR